MEEWELLSEGLDLQQNRTCITTQRSKEESGPKSTGERTVTRSLTGKPVCSVTFPGLPGQGQGVEHTRSLILSALFIWGWCGEGFYLELPESNHREEDLALWWEETDRVKSFVSTEKRTQPQKHLERPAKKVSLQPDQEHTTSGQCTQRLMGETPSVSGWAGVSRVKHLPWAQKDTVSSKGLSFWPRLQYGWHSTVKLILSLF